MSRQKLIDDTLKVTAINKDGKNFERVSRISGKTEILKLEMELDVNTEIYPITEGSYYEFCIANSLTQDGEEKFDLFRNNNNQDQEMAGGTSSNLIDQYAYVMYGKIFEDQIVQEGTNNMDDTMISVYISFGGLLLKLTGKIKDLKDLEMDSRIYFCMKKTG